MAELLESVGAIAGGGFEGIRFGEQVKQEREKLKLEGEELRGVQDFRRQRLDVERRGVGVREEEVKLQREKFKAEQERKQPIDFSQAVNQFPRSVKAELFSLAKATGKLDENNMIPADEAEDFREDIQDNSALMIRLANTGIKDFSDDIEALTARKAEILRKRGIAPSLGNNPTFIAGDKELAPLQAELDVAMQGKADYAGIKQHFEGVEAEERTVGSIAQQTATLIQNPEYQEAKADLKARLQATESIEERQQLVEALVSVAPLARKDLNDDLEIRALLNEGVGDVRGEISQERLSEIIASER